MIENRRVWLALTIFVAAAASRAAWSGEQAFPRPASLEPAIHFWTRVYTEVDTHGGFIHDAEHLDIVYKIVRARDESRRERRREIQHDVRHFREILLKLGRGARTDLSAEERRVLALWPKGTTSAQFRHAANQIRFQLGQADRFRAGLVRSGRWKQYIEKILQANGVPLELAALPHVESSFDPDAYSKVGAAGLWQFTRSTGLRYMRIDHVVDERRDPFMSTNAAARLLRDNYDVLQSWPLAITAYNHGQAGMRRAVSELGTTDIGVIVQKYDSRTFGFASRNFYAAFLAAVDIDEHPDKYFGAVRRSPPLETLVAPVPDYMKARTLAAALGVGLGTLRKLNPALTEAVWQGDKFVPRAFPLRLPAAAVSDPGNLLAAVPATQRYTAQQPDVQHRVRRGETLSGIAASYSVSLASLIRINGLRDGDFIRAGQVLALPLPSKTPPETLAAADSSDGQYIVRPGDTLDRIAKAFDLDLPDLLQANNISDRNMIVAGQTLVLPKSADAAPAGVADVADRGGRPAAVPAVDTSASGGPAAIPAVASLSAAPQAEATLASAAAAAAPGPIAAPGGNGSASAGDGSEPSDSAPAAGADDDSGATAPSDADDQAAAAGDDTDTALDSDSNALASNQSELAADPSDYSVADDGTITVQSLETLGHYADWLEIRTQHLRDINRLPFHRAVVIGQSLKLDFSKVSPDEFERRRTAYHQKLQEDFFSRYRITSIEDHVVRRGESLWVLARHTYSVPVWLLRQYNPDLDLDHVAPGAVVKFPRLKPITDEGDGSDNGDGKPSGGHDSGGDGVV